MTSGKTYGQFCGLARSLDRVGDRWTLLVVRELLLGPRTFRELTQALEGISPNLLSHRLRTLADDGLVLRNDAPARSKTVIFRLTDAGEALEPVVLDLIRWGARWMIDGPGGDLVDPRWTLLALRALLDGPRTRKGRDAIVHIDTNGVPLTIRIRGGKRSVHPGYEGAALASVTAPMTTLLSAASGLGGLRGSDVQIVGDVALISDAFAAGS
jgi:DNA-binding HxlR family transcriptional regulator